MKKWRLLDSGPNDNYTNMAVDEALLEGFASSSSAPILRIYTWHPEAFSIGLSQDPAIELDLEKCAESRLSFVRRMTGGGVIFHADELTYSIVCAQHTLGKKCFAKETYRNLCSFIINAYKDMGLGAQFSLIRDNPPKTGWVCFRERERYDIIINGKKIGGNAQRRKRDIIFQHGSIPIKSCRGRFAEFLNIKNNYQGDESYSLSQALGKQVSYNYLKGFILDAFKKSFNAELIPSKMNPHESCLADSLLRLKYTTKEWNFYRHVKQDKARVA
ncbi:MAG: lipoate--protein ligase family protein [Candidatus Omnitrophica bacterium]|nr:lipoate--protein ligase family protein [Candidatus Omnitrophota bacterium]